MKKVLLMLMALVLSVPIWASEYTVTIHRGEGLYQDGTGVYYCVKDGIMMTFTDGLDNDNYLIERRAKTFEVRSANYIIKKVVFHCVDNTTQDNLDCFYWGPTTISLVSNFTYPGQLGNYYVTNNGYDGVWEGQTAAFMFTTADGKPVRFGSVEITYDKLDGDIFELVTQRSQVVNGDTYIIVSQYHDKVMSFKKTDDATFPSANIVEWMNAAKTKVKVDGNACMVRMLGAKDTTYTSSGSQVTRRVARLSTLNNGYIRIGTGTDQGNLLVTTSVNDYSRGLMYFGTNSNFLCWFKGDNYSNSSHTIRYDDTDHSFKVMSTVDSDTRVWLYKLAQSYNVYKECDPNNGGYIDITDGVWEDQSQEGETVRFKAGTNWGYRIRRVVVINLTTNDTTVLTPDEVAADGNNYHFVMPGAHVKIRAEFYETEPDLYLLGTAMGRTSWVVSGPKFNYDAVNEEYYLDVYFKGGNDDAGADQDYGYFSLTKRIDTGITWQTAQAGAGDWGLLNGQRLAATVNNYGVHDGMTEIPLSSNNPNNAFKIPAGVYRIYVNKAMTQMRIVETHLSLTINPPSGEYPVGTQVTLTSDLESTVHAIADYHNVNEDDATFVYIVNNGTPTQGDSFYLEQPIRHDVYGESYIGYIKVSNTAVYTVIETPLAYIEDEIDPDNDVIVSDELIGAWAVDYYNTEKQKQYKLLWARDEALSINPTYINAETQGDYVRFAGFQTSEWLQNNWVVLDFSNIPDADVDALVNTKLSAGTVKGHYSDGENYTIVLSHMPEPNGDATGYYGYCEDNNETKHNDYLYNHYMSLNFNQANLSLDGNPGAHPGTGSVVQDTLLFFMNPKIQEVAHVMGVWMGQGYDGRDVFTVYNQQGTRINGFDLSGSFYVDWTFNRLTSSGKIYGKPSELQDTAYTFHAGIARSAFDPGTPSGTSGMRSPKPTAPDGSFMVYPFDLPNSPSPTSVQNFVALRQVVDVRYYNVMGMQSDRPFEGINIVVTRYSDGSTSTVKIVR